MLTLLYVLVSTEGYKGYVAYSATVYRVSKDWQGEVQGQFTAFCKVKVKV